MGNDADTNGSKTRRPAKGRFRNTTDRLRQGKDGHLSHRASLDWRLDQRLVCETENAPADIVSIDELVTAVKASRTGEAMLQDARRQALDIVYDTQSPASQYYYRGERHIITLNPYRPKGDLINLLARELRRASQQMAGALVNPMSFEPDEAILVNRAQMADALMVSIKVAWELKLADMPEAWDFLVGSPMADVSRMFEIKAQADFRTLNNGQAARAAYDKFFEDSRTKIHDKRIIHQMLLDEAGYMKAADKRARVSMELFKRLGEMPHGRNYLSMHAQHAPTDMCYATVEDRSNANFLWFIKFERSFQEKELQMMEESVKLSAEVVDFAGYADRSKRTRHSEQGH
ncbi:MAG: hypothetical protein GC185_08005 [Alphaproteobacteria bacterium]|nr:hypothetical protein [Alphaproteobacteria bacterium]